MKFNFPPHNVIIEAKSIEEATKEFHKQQKNASTTQKLPVDTAVTREPKKVSGNK